MAIHEDCIDTFCHFLPLEYCAAVEAAAVKPLVMFKRAQQISVMVDLEARLQMLEEFPHYQQIISLASPPTEVLAPQSSVALSQIANDQLARATATAQERIVGFVATLPLNDVQASLLETRRAVEKLGAVGVQIFTSVLGQPLDSPQFQPLFALLADFELPILLHPTRAMTVPDYPDEAYSKCDMWWAIGWPYQTTLALIRLALSGIFDRHPNLNIIAHHVGGYLPMLSGRLGPGMELLGTRNPPEAADYVQTPLQEPLLQACERFHADTASFGSQAAIECGKTFFGAEQLLFATDMPFDPQRGPGYIRSTLAAIQAMNLTDNERQLMLSGNARRLFHL